MQLSAGKCTNYFLSGERSQPTKQGKDKQDPYSSALELHLGRENKNY